jgi:hypothetical protein
VQLYDVVAEAKVGEMAHALTVSADSVARVSSVHDDPALDHQYDVQAVQGPPETDSCPAAQLRQEPEDVPGVAAYLLAGQLVHEVWPAIEYWLAKHATGAMAAFEHWDPAGHCVHAVVGPVE